MLGVISIDTQSDRGRARLRIGSIRNGAPQGHAFAHRGRKTLNLGVQPVAQDKCNLLKVFGPYWTANRESGRPASVHTRGNQARLTEGSPLIIDLMTPAFDSYVNVDYYMLDGSVVHLLPNARAITRRRRVTRRRSAQAAIGWSASRSARR